jgi:hypothetical protein
VPKILFDANTVLAATSDNTPVALTVGASTLVGRGSAGAIAALTPAQSRTVIEVPFSPASASGPASLPLAEDTDNGTETATLIAAASLGASVTLTLDASATVSDLASLTTLAGVGGSTLIGITDIGGYFAGGTVEAALQEIGAGSGTVAWRRTTITAAGINALCSEGAGGADCDGGGPGSDYCCTVPLAVLAGVDHAPFDAFLALSVEFTDAADPVSSLTASVGRTSVVDSLLVATDVFTGAGLGQKGRAAASKGADVSAVAGDSPKWYDAASAEDIVVQFVANTALTTLGGVNGAGSVAVWFAYLNMN